MRVSLLSVAVEHRVEWDSNGVEPKSNQSCNQCLSLARYISTSVDLFVMQLQTVSS